MRVLFCGRSFELLVLTSSYNFLALRGLDLCSVMLYASECASFVSRHVLFQRSSVFGCVLFEHQSV